MDYLQYFNENINEDMLLFGFKPCYKWITFNTECGGIKFKAHLRFKPCYKWITFNTLTEGIDAVFMVERSHFYMVAKIIHFSVF